MVVAVGCTCHGTTCGQHYSRSGALIFMRFGKEQRSEIMKELTNPASIKLKGLLFLFLGLFSSALVYLQQPTLRLVLLLAVAVWSFCRFYYFAFYVIQHYVDPGYRFSGLLTFAMYMFRKQRGKSGGGRKQN